MADVVVLEAVAVAVAGTHMVSTADVLLLEVAAGGGVRDDGCCYRLLCSCDMELGRPESIRGSFKRAQFRNVE